MSSQKSHGFYAIGSQMQTNRAVDIAKSLPRQPDIAEIVFDEQNLCLRWFTFGGVHKVPFLGAPEKHKGSNAG